MEILRITDGTITVDLNTAARFGIHLEGMDSWRPGVGQHKDGGVWRSSPLADGRQPVFHRWGNILDTFNLVVNGVEQDSVIYMLQNLFRLLEKAAAYWETPWQDEIVYLEARATCESETRYAAIYSWRLPELDNISESEFLNFVVGMEGLNLVVEHTLWLDNIPGTGAAVELSALEAYDGRNLGNVNSAGVRQPTTNDEVYIANKRNEANLTDIYTWSAANGYGLNLMNAALPYALIDVVGAAPAVGDRVNFGIDTALADSGPFCSLVFDIGTTVSGITLSDWEYWNGAWGNLTVQDNTDADGLMTGTTFDTAGVRSVHWSQPSDWITLNVNGVTGYWVRARVTAVPGPHVAPTQQNRDVYSIVWPYVEIEADQVGGDIPSLARINAPIQSDKNSGVGGPALWANRMIVGLRSLSRGQNFSAYINFADEQNPANITVSAVGVGAFANRLIAPTGRCIAVLNPAASALVASVFIAYPLSPEYGGTYHMFIRGRQTGGVVGDITFEVWVTTTGFLSATSAVYQSPVVAFQNNSDFAFLDFGQISLPATTGGADYLGMSLAIFAAGDGVADADLFDLILIPVDEWAADVQDVRNDAGARIDSRGLVTRRYLDVDAIAGMDENWTGLVKEYGNDLIVLAYVPIGVEPPILQANSAQRLWFFTPRFGTAGAPTSEIAHIATAFSIQMHKNQRYLAMRGQR